MVPNEPLAVLEEWTAQNYSAKKTELKGLKKARTDNLAGTTCNDYSPNPCIKDSNNNDAFQRKKREDADTDYSEWDLEEHVREKRAVQHDSYYPMVLPEFELYGIKPSGGALDAATTG